jgi:hypothetical protein
LNLVASFPGLTLLHFNNVALFSDIASFPLSTCCFPHFGPSFYCERCNQLFSYAHRLLARGGDFSPEPAPRRCLSEADQCCCIRHDRVPVVSDPLLLLAQLCCRLSPGSRANEILIIENARGTAQ